MHDHLTDSENDRIQVALCVLWQTLDHTGRDLPLESQKAYLMALGDLGAGRIEQACVIASERCRYFPKPAELRGFVCPDVRLQAIEAWQSVMRNATGFRLRKTMLDFGPMINATVRLVGGADRFCGENDSDLENYTRPRFIEAFILLANSAECREKIGGEIGNPLRAGITQGNSVMVIGNHRPRIGNAQPRIVEVTELTKRLTEQNDGR